MAPLAALFPSLPALPGSAAVALGIVAVAVTLYVVNWALFWVPLPPGVQLLREPPGKRSFSLRTRLQYYTNCEALFREAYNQYVKQGKAVVLPGLGFRHEVILPTSSMKWVQAQPASVLNVPMAMLEVDHVKHSFGSEHYVLDDWGGHLVKSKMNAVLENLCHAMNEELGVAFDAHFGTDTENWKDIDLFRTVRMIVAQAASRFTVGLPLCRNEEYLRTSLDIADGCVFVAGLNGAMPRLLQGVVGPFVGRWQVRRKAAIIKRHLEPVYRERVAAILQQEAEANSGTGQAAHEEPQDHLQMMLRFALRERPNEFADLGQMTKRIMLANFGSMHQTSMQVTNMLLNILGSDAEFNTIAVLRDEIARVIGDGDSVTWTKAHVAKLIRADSVARETLRLQSFGGRAVMRKVLVDVDTDGGVHLPKGTLISFLGRPAQTDAATFDEPMKYDPFRFSRVREGGDDARLGDAKGSTLSFVTTSPEHLPFGHGKNACPGRFLIDFELKMIISTVLSKYDIRFNDGQERPQNRWMAEAVLPPDGARISVRRRK